MTDQLRWGIAGSGSIAAHFASDLALGRSGRVTRVWSRTADRAAAFARRVGAATAPDLGALASAADVDVVYVATPPAQHADHCLAILAAGKPVLCEKPFATDAAAAREVVEAARAADLFCMEAMWTRFLPVMVDLRRRVRAGELGRVAQVSADLGFARAETEANAAIVSHAAGGGALLDLGVYAVSMAHDLLGPPRDVTARAVRSAGGNLREVAAVMTHGPDAAPVLSVLRASHGTQLPNRLTVSGEAGRIEIDAPFLAARHGRQVAVHPETTRPPPPSRLRRAVAGSPVMPILRRLTGRAGLRFGGAYPGHGLGLQADEVARCLRSGLSESAIMPLHETLAVAESLDRIRAAAAAAVAG